MKSEKFTENLCPITGLPVTRRKQWKDLSVSESYSVTFELVGDRILVARAKGDMAQYDQKRYYELREEVIRDALGEKAFVEIKDYSDLYGIPDRKQRRNQSNQIERERGRLLGYFPFNASLFIRAIFSVGLMGRTESIPMKVVRDYETAIVRAVETLGAHQLSGYDYAGHMTQDNFLTRDMWEYRSDAFTVEFRVMPDTVLFFRASGTLSADDIPGIHHILQRIFDEGLFAQPFYSEIGDLTDLKTISISARKYYIDMVRSIHRKYRVKIRSSYIINARFPIRAILFFVAGILRYDYHFASSLEAAFSMAEQNVSIPVETPGKDVTIAVEDIESLVKYMGSIAWENRNEPKPASINRNHPLRILYDAIELVRFDFYALLEKMEQKNRELEAARTKAQKASKSKSRYLSTISHEIRTPLNSITGFSDLLTHTDLDETQADYARCISLGSRTLLSIVNDILDLSRIEADSLSINARPTDIRSLMAETSTMMHFSARRKNLSLKAQTDDTIPKRCFTDPVRLKQVLINLVGNALKFTEEGGVTLRAERVDNISDKSSVTVRFSVSDTGIGIPDDVREKIFQPFSQASRTTAREYGGSGLGLTISRSLVEKLGGTLRVDSKKGKGSTFSFELTMEDTTPDEKLTHRDREQINSQ